MWKPDSLIALDGHDAATHPQEDDAWERRVAAIRELMRREFTEEQAIAMVDRDED